VAQFAHIAGCRDSHSAQRAGERGDVPRIRGKGRSRTGRVRWRCLHVKAEQAPWAIYRRWVSETSMKRRAE
jgi:hypothetical protein